MELNEIKWKKITIQNKTKKYVYRLDCRPINSTNFIRIEEFIPNLKENLLG